MEDPVRIAATAGIHARRKLGLERETMRIAFTGDPFLLQATYDRHTKTIYIEGPWPYLFEVYKERGELHRAIMVLVYYVAHESLHWLQDIVLGVKEYGEEEEREAREFGEKFTDWFMAAVLKYDPHEYDVRDIPYIEEEMEELMKWRYGTIHEPKVEGPVFNALIVLAGRA